MNTREKLAGSDKEALGVGLQAIYIAQQFGHTGIAIVRFQVVGDHFIPTVHELTPRQQAHITEYLREG